MNSEADMTDAIAQAVVCGARTRSGEPCREMPVSGKTRCRLHGGLSTGAKTAEGRARISEAMRRTWEKRFELGCARAAG